MFRKIFTLINPSEETQPQPSEFIELQDIPKRSIMPINDENFYPYWLGEHSDKLKEIMAIYLEIMIKKSGVTTLAADSGNITYFHGCSESTVSITDYFIRLYENFHKIIPVTTYIAALALIKRISKGMSVNVLTIHRLLLISICVASKFNDEIIYSNDSYAWVGGISKKEMNFLEREFLNHPLIDYNPVSCEEFHSILFDLLDLAAIDYTKTILPTYLFSPLCYIVSEYINFNVYEIPSLNPYISFCRSFPRTKLEEDKRIIKKNIPHSQFELKEHKGDDQRDRIYLCGDHKLNKQLLVNQLKSEIENDIELADLIVCCPVDENDFRKLRTVDLFTFEASPTLIITDDKNINKLAINHGYYVYFSQGGMDVVEVYDLIKSETFSSNTSNILKKKHRAKENVNFANNYFIFFKKAEPIAEMRDQALKFASQCIMYSSLAKKLEFKNPKLLSFFINSCKKFIDGFSTFHEIKSLSKEQSRV